MSEQERPAGRELDAQIAERVFGQTVERDWPCWMNECGDWVAAVDRHELIIRPYVENHPVTALRTDGGWMRYDVVPRFSTDIGAAWTVVETLARRGFAVDVRYSFAGYPYCECQIDELEEIADGAPLAICRAALRFVEKGNLR